MRDDDLRLRAEGADIIRFIGAYLVLVLSFICLSELLSRSIMSIPKTQKVWILNERPTSAIKENTFKLEEKPVTTEDELKDGEMLLKVIALSNDPAQRTWMDDDYKPVRCSLPLW